MLALPRPRGLARVAVPAAATLLLAATAVGRAEAQPTTSATYRVTLENLTSGQPLSPPVVVTHDSSARVFERGALASDGVAAVAEAGDDGPLAAALAGVDAVTDVVQVGRPLAPSGSDAGGFTDRATVTIDAGEGDVLSLVGMLICTNDGFVGVDSVGLPATTATYDVNSYDAGVEDNSEVSEDLVDPCSALGPRALPGDPDGNRTAEVATTPAVPIVRHPGIAGGSELSAADHGWTDPAARLHVERVLPSYAVWLSNTTEGQPFSPPVFATHGTDASVFSSGALASDGVAAVAQAGDPAPLAAALQGADAVTDVVSLGRPVAAGVGAAGYAGTAIATLRGAPGDVVSFVGMLICTNDGFAGVDALALPNEATAVGVNDYDAGVEDNTEISQDLVDPCSGLGPVPLDGDPDGNDDVGPATDPALPIARHGNITGVGELTVADHGWDMPVADLVVARVVDAFTDDDGSVHEDAVDALAALGILTGTADGDMEVAGTLTRGMLASLLASALDLPDTAADAFADDDGSVHEDAIDRLAAAGLLKPGSTVVVGR